MEMVGTRRDLATDLGQLWGLRLNAGMAGVLWELVRDRKEGASNAR